MSFSDELTISKRSKAIIVTGESSPSTSIAAKSFWYFIFFKNVIK